VEIGIMLLITKKVEFMSLATYGMIINDQKELNLIYQLLLICITSSILLITR